MSIFVYKCKKNCKNSLW